MELAKWVWGRQVQTVREIEKTGQDQYMTERVIERTTPVFDPVSKNQMPLFSRPPSRGPSKTKQTITPLKSDCTLFSRLYIATQTRDGDLDNFFKHENLAYSPSLSLPGKLRFGTNSDLVECLEKLCTSCGETPVAEVIILVLLSSTCWNPSVWRYSKILLHIFFYRSSRRSCET